MENLTSTLSLGGLIIALIILPLGYYFKQYPRRKRVNLNYVMANYLKMSIEKKPLRKR